MTSNQPSQSLTKLHHKTRTVAFAPPPQPFVADHTDDDPEACFAFVQLKRAFCLILIRGQTVPPSADPTPLLFDIAIFFHEFISMWRFSHTVQVDPKELRVLLRLDIRSIRYEEDKGTVFLAKHLMPELGSIMKKQGHLGLRPATRQRT